MTLGKPKSLYSRLTRRVVLGFESRYEGQLRECAQSSVHCPGGRVVCLLLILWAPCYPYLQSMVSSVSQT